MRVAGIGVRGGGGGMMAVAVVVGPRGRAFAERKPTLLRLVSRGVAFGSLAIFCYRTLPLGGVSTVSAFTP